MEEQNNTNTQPTENKTVLVTNINISKDEDPVETLSNFFSYCGTITNLYSEPSENGMFRAYITFEDVDSVKTALFVTGGNLNGQPIHIEVSPTSDVPVQTQGIHNQPPPNTEDNTSHEYIRSMTSIVSSLLAAGYSLSNDAIAKAKEFDDQHGIVDKLMVTKNIVQNKFEELDEKLKKSKIQ